jgi:hypothetical protein
METCNLRLSRPLILLAAALFAAGVGTGTVTYLHRSPVREQHLAGTAAWGQQAAVAALAVLTLAVAYWRSRRSGRRIWLLRPLGRPAASRVARLTRDALGARDRGPRPAALGRAVLALPLAALFGYGFWRAGFQVTNGLDPNATANAWGGPTYAGALACHYLDLVVIMAALAWLLDRVLPGRTPAARGAGPVPAVVSLVGYLGGNDSR